MIKNIMKRNKICIEGKERNNYLLMICFYTLICFTCMKLTVVYTYFIANMLVYI